MHIRKFLIVSLAVLGCANETQYKLADGGNLNVPKDGWEKLPKKDVVNAPAMNLLTVEESLGLVFRSPQANNLDLNRAVNPDPISQLLKSIDDGNQVDRWAGAIACLSFVGHDSEARRFEKILTAKHPKPIDRDVSLAFDSAQFALGRMARRGVPETRRIVEQSCTREYWAQTEQPWDNGRPLGDHGRAIVDAHCAKLIANWRIDDQFLTDFMDATASGFSREIERSNLLDALCRAWAAESAEITQQERDELNDLHDEHFATE